jgi:hypothetical protein
MMFGYEISALLAGGILLMALSAGVFVVLYFYQIAREAIASVLAVPRVGRVEFDNLVKQVELNHGYVEDSVTNFNHMLTGCYKDFHEDIKAVSAKLTKMEDFAKENMADISHKPKKRPGRPRKVQ